MPCIDTQQRADEIEHERERSRLNKALAAVTRVAEELADLTNKWVPPQTPMTADTTLWLANRRLEQERQSQAVTRAEAARQEEQRLRRLARQAATKLTDEEREALRRFPVEPGEDG